MAKRAKNSHMALCSLVRIKKLLEALPSEVYVPEGRHWKSVSE